MWRPSDATLVQPPIKRRPPGRPKKKRAKEPNKPTRRAGISKQCKTCGKLGHNKRSCKGEIGGNSSLPGTTNRTSASSKSSMQSRATPSAPPPSAPPQSSMHSTSQSSLQSRATPSAPPQSSMHSPATPSAPSQAKTSSATQNVTPNARTRSTFIHSYTQQHSSTQAAPYQSGSTTQNLGAHQNSSSSNPKPRQKKRRLVTSVHGPRK
nr:hypothetical protein CFP56_65385 [Quercus suber]